MKEDIKHEEGNLKAVQVVLQLPKSSYATMAIR
jgi:tRNA(Glu) U13 pseudouridine synthase TruD